MKSAIDFERVMKAPLREVKATEFLAALSQARLGRDHLHLVADKKKYELFIEEGVLDDIPVGALIDKLREKKKLELEPGPDLRDRIDPAIYERLVEEVATRVQTRLSGVR